MSQQLLDWEAAGLMIFRLAYEKCGLNQFWSYKPQLSRIFPAGCGLAKLRLASRLKFAAYQSSSCAN